MRAALLLLIAGAVLIAANKKARASIAETVENMTLRVDWTMLENRNVRAFLAMIRKGEGTADPAGYRRLFGGALFDSFDDHPRTRVTLPVNGKPLTSTAAGAYQFLSRTWDEAAAALGLDDFSPPSQDLAAVWLIRRRGALADVIAGRFDTAVEKCAKEWASLPGAGYGQPEKTLAQARLAYASAGGTFA